MRNRHGNYRLEYSLHDDEYDLNRILIQGSAHEFVTLTDVLDGLVVPWLKACGYQFESLDVVHTEEHECRCTPGTATDADVI